MQSKINNLLNSILLYKYIIIQMKSLLLYIVILLSTVFPFQLTKNLRNTDRAFLFGCGVTWGEWLGFDEENALKWDSMSMDKIQEMGGTNIGVSLPWHDIEP